MEQDKKITQKINISDLPEGLKELVEIPPAQGGQPERPKTQKEQELSDLITLRQGIIEKLKQKNPQVAQARKKLAEAIPAVRGKGASQVMRLVEEEEKLEFLIATEAYTPKKEKDMLKRMREIRLELSRHKELDEARKKVDAGRSLLRGLMSEIRSLEQELAEARNACDAKYAEVLQERKSAYERRQRGREARQLQEEEARQHRFDDLRRRVREEKHREEDAEAQKYMKDYDDTVSMDEICVIEKKEKKKEDAPANE